MENLIENYDALFNARVEIKEEKATGNEYKPGPDKGKGGTYKSIIRFIPWYKDPVHGSIQEKWTCWLVNPLSQKGRYVDCPSSIGKQSPLQDMYWKLKKSDSVAQQKKADVFSRRHNYASLIQVIKDENAPELEGKILVYRYGVKIWEKINAELKPVIGKADDPFNILNGKAFALYITRKGEWPNYDNSKFLETHRIPLVIPNPEEDGKLVPINENTDKATVFNYVKDNSPDLGKYAFNEWDQDIHDYVNSVIAAVTGQANESANFAGVKNAGDPVGSVVDTGIIATNINLEEINTPSVDDLPNLDLPTGLGAEVEKPSTSGIGGSLDEALKGL